MQGLASDTVLQSKQEHWSSTNIMYTIALYILICGSYIAYFKL
jgi:hypothetical protein